MGDFYEVLELGRDASYRAIDQAYERLVALQQGDAAALSRLVEAYSTLSNPLTRNRYDQALAARPAEPPPAPRYAAPEEPPVPPRPGTELLDTTAPPYGYGAPPQRPATELIDVGRPPASPNRPATEALETFVSPPPNRSSRPPTEPIAVPPSAGAPRHPTREESAVGAPPGQRPWTEVLPTSDATAAPPARSARPAPLGPIRVVVELPNETTEEYQLGDGRHVLGRKSKSGVEPAVKLTDPFVSREHAYLIKQGTSLTLADNNSVNGTRLNGARLDPGRPYPLGEDDVVEIESFKLRVVFPRDAP